MHQPQRPDYSWNGRSRWIHSLFLDVLLKKSEELLGNPTRSIRSSFSANHQNLIQIQIIPRDPLETRNFERKKYDVSFVPFRRWENKEMADRRRLERICMETIKMDIGGVNLIAKMTLTKLNERTRFMSPTQNGRRLCWYWSSWPGTFSLWYRNDTI